MSLRRGWLSRIAIVGVSALLLWLLAYLFRQPRVTIKEEPPSAATDQMQSEQVEVRVFDTTGRATDQVKAQKGRQGSDQSLHLQGVEASITTAAGRTIHFFADHYDQGLSERILRAEPDSRIEMEEESGMSMQTVGPIVMGEQDIISTQAAAQFQFGDFQGQTNGLKYLSQNWMILESDIAFWVPERLHFSGQHMQVDLIKNYGTMQRGEFRQLGEPLAKLQAPTLLFFFVPGRSGLQQTHLESMQLYGPDCMLQWQEGSFVSKNLSVCMDAQNRLAQVDSRTSAVIDLAAVDGFRMRGQTGKLSLVFQNGSPEHLEGQGRVKLNGRLGPAQFVLESQEGLQTEFELGQVAETTLSGLPVFQYEGLKGEAGRIRLLHRENRILLSENAELDHPEEQFHLWGEEILIANWSQGSREVYGRGFVRLVTQRGEAPIEAKGDSISLVFPERWLRLEGHPAVFAQNDQRIEAEVVRVLPTYADQLKLFADGNLVFSFPLNGQPSTIRGASLVAETGTGTVVLRDVQEALLGQIGKLSARELKLSTHEDRSLDQLIAQGEVHFSGVIETESGPQRFSGRSDRLTYQQSNQEVVMEGQDRDVVLLLNERNEFRGRSLTYNLIDGSMRADSGPHAFGKTIFVIPRKQEHD